MTASERAAGRYLRDGNGHPTPEQLASQVKAKFDSALDAVKSIADQALGKAKSGEELTNSLKEKADDALLKLNGLNEQMAELEQKMARGAKGGDDAQKSAGELFANDEKVKSFLAGDPSSGKVDVRMKATLTSLTTDAAGSVGDAIANTRLPGLLALPQRRLTVRDLLSQGQMDGNTLEYVKETGFVNNAAPVAQGAAKPSSDMKLDLVTTSAKVIAHWMKASKQVLSDISQLRSIIDQRLLYGLAYVEEAQLLNGDGTGQNLNGIIPQATAYSAPITLSSPTSIDMIRLMMLQAALAEYPATGVVLHPSDWAWIETLKDTTGRYIIGNPQGTINPTLWGLPVVATQAMTVDKVLVGAFKLGAQVFDRWDARVETGFVNDDFTKNLVTILAEERLALAVYRPEAFVYGDFGRVT
ncbi:phage major capsid protein [Agrobacterium tumefaciens]|uniref:Phage major capsid protein n=1 Tax=Agrobacterium tumefaciens TaxID=358 RepID=A0AA44F428_AGRTU|nr:phage major capsid protein [Agrobacterium tumefaciens]NSL20560.1 phage major capsid protein [Agrobacterium tumefaciens]NTB85023.1 phage major capsid protein [Agrobacterium tumefaciens]NTC15554.1 phage major capsid protein [Agrobacterium tumefaciens]NTC28073.1 phage major capsid protein [Agrobacterium tumefaciens]NTC54923.1 phage major capsid protein [Agrobacterium tumefaciens]